jgi:hypothetical protein
VKCRKEWVPVTGRVDEDFVGCPRRGHCGIGNDLRIEWLLWLVFHFDVQSVRYTRWVIERGTNVR